IDFGLCVIPILLHVDERFLFARNAVVRLIPTPGETAPRGIADEGSAQRATFRVAGTVWNVASNAVRLLSGIDQLLAQCVGLRKVGDFDVIGLPIEIIAMEGEGAEATLEAQRPGALFKCGIPAQLDRTRHAL